MSFELYAIKSPPCVGHVRPESLPVSHAAHILKTLNQTTSRTPEYDSRYKVLLSLVIYLPNRFRCQTSKSPTLAGAHPEVDEPGPHAIRGSRAALPKDRCPGKLGAPIFKQTLFARCKDRNLVELRRIELLTPCLQSRCSPS